MSELVLIRHGQSEWNAKNIFTGFRDIGLSEKGEAEARAAGKALTRRAIDFDIAFTSALKRAQISCELILQELGQSEIEIVKHASLNERDYGALSGMNKDDARKKFGAEQIHLWRRSFNMRPPEGESLEDTAKRVRSYFENKIIALWHSGQDILIVAHGNSLRALVMVLEGLSPEEIVKIEIPTGQALIYQTDKDLATERVI